MRQGTPIRILSVDDHAFLIAGLRAKTESEHDLELIAHLQSADHVVGEVERLRPDIVLLDIEMPGRDPFEALEDLSRCCSFAKVIMLSAYVRDNYIDAAVRAGAWGYLSKRDEPDFILDAIRRVAAGEFAVSNEVAQRCGDEPGDIAEWRPSSKLTRLTPRELQILRMIGKGMPRTAIAKAIHRSPKTVDAHRASIMEKLSLHDRVDLARFAIREGLVEI